MALQSWPFWCLGLPHLQHISLGNGTFLPFPINLLGFSGVSSFDSAVTTATTGPWFGSSFALGTLTILDLVHFGGFLHPVKVLLSRNLQSCNFHDLCKCDIFSFSDNLGSYLIRGLTTDNDVSEYSVLGVSLWVLSLLHQSKCFGVAVL